MESLVLTQSVCLSCRGHPKAARSPQGDGDRHPGFQEEVKAGRGRKVVEVEEVGSSRTEIIFFPAAPAPDPEGS